MREWRRRALYLMSQRRTATFDASRPELKQRTKRWFGALEERIVRSMIRQMPHLELKLITALLVLHTLGAPGGWALPAHQQRTSAQGAESLTALRERIAAHIAQPKFAPAAWGVKIVSLDTGKTIFEHNPQKYFNPAS